MAYVSITEPWEWITREEAAKRDYVAGRFTVERLEEEIVRLIETGRIDGKVYVRAAERGYATR